jgi:hypothetical protein
VPKRIFDNQQLLTMFDLYCKHGLASMVASELGVTSRAIRTQLRYLGVQTLPGPGKAGELRVRNSPAELERIRAELEAAIIGPAKLRRRKESFTPQDDLRLVCLILACQRPSEAARQLKIAESTVVERLQFLRIKMPADPDAQKIQDVNDVVWLMRLLDRLKAATAQQREAC